MSRRRAVVTGAAGFIGSAVAHRLVADGWEVLALVRPSGSRERLADLAREPRLSLEELDVAADGAAARARDLLAAFAPEAVVHAAWRGVRGPDRQDPAQHRNVTAAVELLQAAAAAGARRFVGLGSQAEYGPRREAAREDDPTRPTSVYGAAKLAAGHLVLAIAPRLGVSAAWVRVFSIYGPGEGRGALLPDAVAALRAGRELPLTSGEQLWDYLYVDDAADALARLVASPEATGPFNLGSGRVVRIRDVVERLAALVPARAPLRFGALPDGEVAHLEANVERLRRTTGWEPRVALDEGLARLARAAGPDPA
jgi:UDP-glucose 4-epimerase